MTRTPAQIGAANRRRGAQVERAVVTWLRDHGWPHAERAVRTGYTTASRTSTDPGDITGTPGIVWQVTDRGDIDQDSVLARRLAETEAQRVAAEDDLGVLVVKRRGVADPGRWWVWLPLVALECLRNGDDRHCDPDAWTYLDRTPVRLELRHLAQMLTAAGYGTAEEVA